ncbi:receptor like protein 29 [Dendrobium catenatum]|uniref:Piriformospora indica-insensitive protein 2 n=1 Tax=Dendrobium catenatum TaxID=906689 RepID=A0A2I0W7E1_9ASPA|nr:receptor like protein 29 [Dendrobium catenatum]PKU71561.1 Piriformospora indica-insensitive protein 2 [Dendrobium catenatum]
MAARIIFLFLLAFLPCSVSVFHSPAMPVDELVALLDLVGGLVAEPGWAELHPHPCTDTPWPGIQCEAAAGDAGILHVTGIHVGADVSPSPPCKPSAFLSPDALLHLPFLKTFSLFGCFLSPNSVSLPPSIFTNSSSLEQLVLDANTGLTGEIPSSVSKLKRLRVLCLSQNAFHGVIPEEIGSLRSLQELDLSYNRFRGEIPVEIGELSSLRIIDLSSNELQGELPASIGCLHSLQKIDFSLNYLSGRVPPELGELKDLVLLDLSNNNLTGPLPDHLSKLNELEYFLMENNPLNTSIPLFLGGLKKLQVIGISGCGLLGSIPSFFASLVSLTALSLDKNSLNGSVPESLESLPKLGQLNLSQNQLSGEIGFSEEFVRRLGKRLDVRDNHGLCTKVHKYQENSFNLEAPPCLGSTVNNGRIGNKSLGGNNGDEETGDLKIKPSSNGNGGTGSWHELGLIFLGQLSLQAMAIVMTLAV